MLQSLHVENYALIDETDVCFERGFAVITGETGAGKSVLLGALGLLLGQRADAQILSNPERKCLVEATFDITGLGLQPLFEQYDADYDDQLILRREILPSGKSRAFVNDSPTNLQMLKELTPHILDIHSQYETLSLTDSRFQVGLLDSFADASLLTNYQELYSRYIGLKHELERLTTQDVENRKELDYNRFLLEELAAAHLDADEQLPLEEESRLLENTGAIKEALGLLSSLCDSLEDDSAIPRLVASRNALSRVASYHDDIDTLFKRLDSAIIEIQDLLSDASALDDRLQFSPERQAFVAERLDLIYRLQKKHGVDTVEALLKAQQRLDEEIRAADSLDDRIRAVMEQVDVVYAQMQKAAGGLTKSRQKAGEQLGAVLLPVLAQLGMSAARLVADIAPASDFGPMGHDKVRFLFSANKGGDFRPLSQVASGGELSRLMLAVKSVVTRSSLLPTIIFDEIDSGVSGDISVAVGSMMRQMSHHMQVIAITHLPQIAAKADQHLWVSKAIEGNRTVSRIRQLDEDERINQIAVMLSSNPPTAAALQTARELMK